MINLFKKGDYVTRKKYNNDILFKIEEINGRIIILSGVNLRLYADADISDLVLSTISKKKEEVDNVRNLDVTNYFYIPGIILHLDSDTDYLNKCNNYYDKQKIKHFGYCYKEKDFKSKVKELIIKHKPSIVVITGHDAYYKNNKYKNSNYFIDTVKEIRSNYKNILIVSGACQSNYNGLIQAGSTYASSPKHINIHALDPAIIASFLALTDKNSIINIEEILNKTKYGPDGIGGIITNGTMISGYPKIKIE